MNFASLSPVYCINAPKDTLTISPEGGTLAGTGISGNVFDAAAAGAGGPYAISYTRTDSFSCFYSDTAYVTVNEVPVVSIAGLDTLYCDNAAAVVITASPAGGILSGAGVTDSVFDPATAGAGTHPVTYTYTANGCSGAQTITVRVKVCTGIDAVVKLPDVKIYPNPVADELFVECNCDKTDDLQIMLTDISGKAVYASCCQSKFRIEVQGLAAGLYFARVQSGKSAVTKKVIVSKN